MGVWGLQLLGTEGRGLQVRGSQLAGPGDWSLLSGPLPAVLAGLGLLSLAWLLFSRRRNWWLRWLPLALLLAAGLAYLIVVWVDDWWQPFPDGLPTQSAVWIGVCVLAVLLFLFRLPLLRWRGRILALVACLLVVGFAGNKVNQQFQQYPTLSTLPGPWQAKPAELAIGDKESTLKVPAGKTIADVWHKPANLPARGTLSTAKIPGKLSGFPARDAYIWLPPAYAAKQRPLLPVLVLLPGQPGAPEDWTTGGQMESILNAYAAAHDGLAPVVVVADPIGSQFGNTLCVNSKLGQAQTYLAKDVPDWIHANLQISPGRKAWTVGGLSFGGTCALQLAVNAPEAYGSFLDMSGQDEPTLGDRGKTVSAAFGGDEAAFLAVDPLSVMAHKRFPDTAGVVLVGDSDTTYGPQQRKVFAACQQAGMNVVFVTMPGGHSWGVWKAGLQQQLTWIAKQDGLSS
ncbi:S-formylglutathione hydrolase FrmB [Streptacidiphilus sp. MAP12-20]|uniref:alpha/beta hydrolase n=1 Tax=Streptacidiphilus sp. MAP12-20 TaxID=3156299 RepID=UPI0035116EC7